MVPCIVDRLGAVAHLDSQPIGHRRDKPSRSSSGFLCLLPSYDLGDPVGSHVGAYRAHRVDDLRGAARHPMRFPIRLGRVKPSFAGTTGHSVRAPSSRCRARPRVGDLWDDPVRTWNRRTLASKCRARPDRGASRRRCLGPLPPPPTPAGIPMARRASPITGTPPAGRGCSRRPLARGCRASVRPTSSSDRVRQRQLPHGGREDLSRNRDVVFSRQCPLQRPTAPLGASLLAPLAVMGRGFRG